MDKNKYAREYYNSKYKEKLQIQYFQKRHPYIHNLDEIRVFKAKKKFFNAVDIMMKDTDGLDMSILIPLLVRKLES